MYCWECVSEESSEKIVYAVSGHLGRPCKKNQAGCSPTSASMDADECPAGQLVTGTICLFV